jgi:hypothetical protein
MLGLRIWSCVTHNAHTYAHTQTHRQTHADTRRHTQTHTDTHMHTDTLSAMWRCTSLSTSMCLCVCLTVCVCVRGGVCTFSLFHKRTVSLAHLKRHIETASAIQLRKQQQHASFLTKSAHARMYPPPHMTHGMHESSSSHRASSQSQRKRTDTSKMTIYLCTYIHIFIRRTDFPEIMPVGAEIDPPPLPPLCLLCVVMCEVMCVVKSLAVLNITSFLIASHCHPPVCVCVCACLCMCAPAYTLLIPVLSP